tara:strand:+ start:368 stop:514 length:147 start_codon:yes stop_codon:yes gene_type:complete
MAKVGAGLMKSDYIEARPKKSRQGRSALSKLSATSRNKKRKKYRGQGK